jgi:hypothetical protein
MQVYMLGSWVVGPVLHFGRPPPLTSTLLVEVVGLILVRNVSTNQYPTQYNNQEVQHL